MFMLSCTQAKMENDKKAIDVKREWRRLQYGKFPGVAPVGYINDPYLLKDKNIPAETRTFWDSS